MATRTNTGDRRSAYTDADRAADRRARVFAAIVGATFLLVGIAGFIPGVTTNLDEIEFAGHDSTAELVGVFQVSVLHNLVHLAFGVAGLALARRADWARGYLLIGGLVYLALALYGAFIEHDSDANFVPVNNADDWLHLGLAAGMILLWLLSLRPRVRDFDDTRGGRRLNRR